MNEQQQQELFELVKENNKILHKLRFHQQVQTVTRILQFLFVIGLFGASYYFLQPYLEKVISLYNQVQETAQTASEFKSTLQGGFLNFLK
jgi:hypothetical protein